MGKADVTALTAHSNNTHTAWYPLQFEEHSVSGISYHDANVLSCDVVYMPYPVIVQYGDICCSFVLIPVCEANARLRGPADDMQSMIEKWETYKIDGMYVVISVYYVH